MQGTFSIPSTDSEKISIGTIGIGTPERKGDYKGIVEFLNKIGKTRILSSPQILAMNNREAKILVGTKDVYITSAVSEVGESAVTTQEINFVDIYRGKGIEVGKKSLTLSLLFRRDAETLTHEQVDGEQEKIVEILHDKFKAILRA